MVEDSELRYEYIDGEVYLLTSPVYNHQVAVDEIYVVEVLSRSTRSKDMLKKFDLYMQSGVKEYWLVDPDKKEIYVYIFKKQDINDNEAYTGDTTVKSKVFDGLEVRLPDIFTF